MKLVLHKFSGFPQTSGMFSIQMFCKSTINGYISQNMTGIKISSM